jgi:hypothetical protein
MKRELGFDLAYIEVYCYISVCHRILEHSNKLEMVDLILQRTVLILLTQLSVRL